MPALPRGEAEALLEQFRQKLRDRRLPVTRQRLAIAQAVLFATDHPSVLDLEKRLRSGGEAIGLATLYRGLELLSEMGLVRERDFGEGFHRYEAAGAVPHDHLVCERCGAVVEFGGERVERMLRLTADEQGFQYRGHAIEVYGRCRACRGRDLAPLTETR